MPGARSTIARAGRELLELHDNAPELWARVVKVLTPENIDTLRELATWDDYLRLPAYPGRKRGIAS